MLENKINIDEAIEKVFDSFKKLTPALLAVAIASGLMLFLPNALLERMGLFDMPKPWRSIVGIIFIIAVALICTIIISQAVSKVAKKQKVKRFCRRKRKEYLKLSDSQRSILIAILRSEEKSLRYDPYNGDIIYLKNSNYILQAEQYTFFGPGTVEPAVFVPQPWLIDLFNQEPELFR